MMSLTGFTVASLLSGLAPTLGALVVFRIIQGATGGVLQPISQSVMLEAFPPRDRGKAMAFWGLGIVVAPMLGPILGGWLTDSYSWRWVFYINLPVGIASLYMTQAFIFDPPYLKRGARSVDGWGIGMLAVGIGALQIMLDKGQQDDWFGSTFIVICAVVAAGLLVAFVIRELVAREPVVHLSVFKSRNYSVGVMMMTTLGFVLYGSLVALPVFLQTLMGYPAVEAGLATAPRGLGAFIGMPFIGVIMSRGVDPRKLLAGGFLVAGLDAGATVAPRRDRHHLGLLLAAVLAGAGPVVHVRAAHDDDHGSHSAGGDGQRDEPLQPDAESRRRLRHCRGDDDDCAQTPSDSSASSASTSRRSACRPRRVSREMQQGVLGVGDGSDDAPRRRLCAAMAGAVPRSGRTARRTCTRSACSA